MPLFDVIVTPPEASFATVAGRVCDVVCKVKPPAVVTAPVVSDMLAFAAEPRNTLPAPLPVMNVLVNGEDPAIKKCATPRLSSNPNCEVADICFMFERLRVLAVPRFTLPKVEVPVTPSVPAADTFPLNEVFPLKVGAPLNIRFPVKFLFPPIVWLEITSTKLWNGTVAGVGTVAEMSWLARYVGKLNCEVFTPAEYTVAT